jgi:hypothetical protein
MWERRAWAVAKGGSGVSPLAVAKWARLWANMAVGVAMMETVGVRDGFMRGDR